MHFTHLPVAQAVRLLIVGLMIPLSGCFTGIESTPKITATDVRREKVSVSDEQRFLAGIEREPIAAWTPGKLFYITDDKVSILFGAEGTTLPSLKGKYLSFVSSADIPSLTGGRVAAFTFMTPEGKEVTYRSQRATAEWEQAGHVEIPFTVERTLVDSVRQLLEGNSYYVITSQWYDDKGQSRRGRKFVNVTIDSVLPGNNDYPVLLALRDDAGDTFRLFMSVGTGLSAPRDFASLFSFRNPRERYPRITDQVWANIINGRVAGDMTRDECRLALGAPAEIDRRPGYSYMREIWIYENGVYLIFEDGLLRSFRY